MKEPVIIVKGTPPSSEELERSVLSALLTDRDAAANIMDILTPDAFYSDTNREVYNCIAMLYSRGSAIDMLTVTDEVRKSGKVDPFYVSELAMMLTGTANAEYYARILTQKQISRAIIRTGIESVTDALQEKTDPIELLDKTEREIYAIGHGITTTDAVQVGQAVPEILKRIEKAAQSKGITGIEGGIRQFDRHTGGFQQGELYILAGRPGMGKTALLLSWALNIAASGVPVGVFSLEMTKDELVMRLLSMLSGVPSANMKKGMMAESQWPELMKASEQLSAMPLYIDDEGGQSASAVRSRARRMVQRNKVQVLFLDYLQKMAAPKQYSGNREAEVNYNVQSLKNIAKELKLPFICLSQLSRAVESRADKKPILSDLRESGAIEQEADMVLFLWRPEYYGITQDAEGNDMSDGYVELDVAKFRHGPTMTIPIKFIGELTRFTDYRHPDDFKGIQQAPVSDFNAWGNAIHDAPVISQHRPNLDVEIPF